MDMDKVDFGYVDKHGFTIYKICFQRYLDARFHLKRNQADWSRLVTKTETIFFHLVEEGKRLGFDVNAILEIPTSTGETCFYTASKCSKAITSYIIEREIKVNSITVDMIVPAFEYPDLKRKMMVKGINPYIIDYSGRSEPVFWDNMISYICNQFSRSVHFSFEDIDCSTNCARDCSSEFRRFYYKNGEFVKMIDANRIGQGGFGSVFKGTFHGEEKAMKCVLIDRIEYWNTIEKAKSNLEKNIAEIRIQIASGGSGVIVPEAFVRQQNQERDDNGKWIAKNYNIYVYSLFIHCLIAIYMNYTKIILINLQKKSREKLFTSVLIGRISYLLFCYNYYSV